MSSSDSTRTSSRTGASASHVYTVASTQLGSYRGCLVGSTSRRVHVASSPHSSARTEHVSSCPRRVASTQLGSYRGCLVVSTSCPRRVASTQLGSYRARLVVSTSCRVHAARLVYRARLVVSTSCRVHVSSCPRHVVSTSRRLHAARLVPRMSCRCQDATAQSPSRRGSLFCTVKMMFAVSKTVLLQYSSCYRSAHTRRYFFQPCSVDISATMLPSLL